MWTGHWHHSVLDYVCQGAGGGASQAPRTPPGHVTPVFPQGRRKLQCPRSGPTGHTLGKGLHLPSTPVALSRSGPRGRTKGQHSPSVCFLRGWGGPPGLVPGPCAHLSCVRNPPPCGCANAPCRVLRVGHHFPPLWGRCLSTRPLGPAHLASTGADWPSVLRLWRTRARSRLSCSARHDRQNLPRRHV